MPRLLAPALFLIAAAATDPPATTGRGGTTGGVFDSINPDLGSIFSDKTDTLGKVQTQKESPQAKPKPPRCAKPDPGDPVLPGAPKCTPDPQPK